MLNVLRKSTTSSFKKASSVKEVCGTCARGSLGLCDASSSFTDNNRINYIPEVNCPFNKDQFLSPMHPACPKWKEVRSITFGYRQRFLEGYSLSLI